MILRVLTLMAGLSGAFGAAQFPEYSQQYRQRLGGAVDELARQVNRHERDAAVLGVSLEQMLVQLSAEGPLAARQAEHIRTDLARHTRLSADLQALQGAGPFMRLRLATHLGDSDVARRGPWAITSRRCPPVSRARCSPCRDLLWVGWA